MLEIGNDAISNNGWRLELIVRVSRREEVWLCVERRLQYCSTV